MLKSVLIVTLGVAVSAAAPSDGARSVDGRRLAAADAIAQSRAAYAALQSYADSGTVVDENATYRDRYAFRTYFTRDPRNLKLDFHDVASEYNDGYRIKGNRRIVVWMRRGALQTWDSKTQEHETYPADGGRQVHAITSQSYITRGMSELVPGLLYSKAGIANPVLAMQDAMADGEEMVGGKRCLKVTGVERWQYPNGRTTGIRPITVWIDAESFLIRKVLQDTPKGMGRGVVSRRITTFDPHANPRLADEQFAFAVPDGQP